MNSTSYTVLDELYRISKLLDTDAGAVEFAVLHEGISNQIEDIESNVLDLKRRVLSDCDDVYGLVAGIEKIRMCSSARDSIMSVVEKAQKDVYSCISILEDAVRSINRAKSADSARIAASYLSDAHQCLSEALRLL